MARLSRLIVSVSLSAAALALPVVAGASGGDVYIVNEGDTLSGIAVAVGVPLEELLMVNDLTPTSVIVPGQHLAVPDVAVPDVTVDVSSTASAGPDHTVAAGDTLGGIAVRYQVSLASLLAINNLTATSLITPGMRLALPATATTAVATSGGTIDAVVAHALAQVGKPYEFFTAGPNAFDCSGLTMAAYDRIGITLIHQSASQARQGSAVDFWHESIRSGDLVFLDSDWDGVIDHVGVALDAATWVQASESRGIVLTAPIPPKSVIVSVRRLVPND